MIHTYTSKSGKIATPNIAFNYPHLSFSFGVLSKENLAFKKQ